MSHSPNSPVPTLTTQPSVYSPQPVYHPSVRSPSLRSQTLSNYGSTSNSASMFGPPLSRDNSAATAISASNYLPTPTDETMHPPAALLARDGTTITSHYRNHAFPEDREPSDQAGSAQRKEGSKVQQPVLTSREPSASIHTKTTPRRRTVRLEQRITATNVSSPVTAPRMARQRSARDLILQYNKLDSPTMAPQTSVSSPSGPTRNPSARSAFSVSLPTRRDTLSPPVPVTTGGSETSHSLGAPNPGAPPSHCVPETPSYFSNFARGRGKMRNSLTNLMQLLGDKSKSKSKDDGSLKVEEAPKKRNSISPSASFRAFSAVLPRGFRLNLGGRNSQGSSPSGSPGKGKSEKGASGFLPDMNELLKSQPIMSDLLLYQSPARQTHSYPNDINWMPYTVSLYPTSIILQVPNPGLSSMDKFQVPISDVYDTHSAAAKDLPLGITPAPGSLPPSIGFGEDIYVFEMYCYGGRLERFAAPSLASRTKWVTCLLDLLMTKSVQAGNDAVPLPGESTLLKSTPSSLQPATSLSSLAHSSLLATMQGEPPGCGSAGRILDPGSEPLVPPVGVPSPARPTRSPSTNSHTTSALPNPWDLPTTPTKMRTSTVASTTTPRPASLVIQRASSTRVNPQTPSFLMSPRSDGGGVAASPSISRLDGRSLVRGRLAVLERQASASSTINSGGSLRGVGGTMNWDALNEVRSARGGSELLRGVTRSPNVTTVGSGGPYGVMSPRPGRTAPPSGSASETPSPNTLFMPKWPFPEPLIPGGVSNSDGPKSKEDMRIPSSNDSTSELDLSAPCIRTLFPSPRGANTRSLPMRLVGRSPSYASTSDPIQVLGNLAPSKKDLQATFKPMESLSEVSELLRSLSVTLRESDAAHSTKASGLGQLIKSTQDHIIQAVEESTKVSYKEHSTTSRHLEELKNTVKGLVDRPITLGIEERAELSVIKSTLGNLEQTVSSRLQDIYDGRGRPEHGDTAAQQIEELKQNIQVLTSKMDGVAIGNEILTRLDGISGTISSNITSTTPALDSGVLEELVQKIKAANSPPVDTSELMSKLESIAIATDNLALPQVDLSTVHNTLDEIRTLIQVRQPEDVPPNHAVTPTDLSDVVMKLDGIAAMCQAFMESKTSQVVEGNQTETQTTQDQLLAALREDAEHRTVQTQQTTELVRYSNELNSWLEKFVMNASTQMDSVGAGINLLRHDLGLAPHLPTEGQTEDSPPQNTVQEIRGMFAKQVKAVGEISASLNALLAAFNEERDQSAQAKQSLATEAVLKMIDVQRQEQERLLKQLATDLSSDIRGERIRFVEAMSQATSMNVQLHVEEFKKQLTHEVLALTDEVGRLREERKTIQHQIAQLFLVKSEHEAELRPSEPSPPRPVLNTRPAPR